MKETRTTDLGVRSSKTGDVMKNEKVRFINHFVRGFKHYIDQIKNESPVVRSGTFHYWGDIRRGYCGKAKRQHESSCISITLRKPDKVLVTSDTTEIAVYGGNPAGSDLDRRPRVS